MKIQMESLGLPTLSGVIGKKTEVELDGGTVTVNDLIDHIVKKHGHKVRQMLLDPDGKLDLSIQVMINEEGFLAREQLGQRTLKEGDRVRFLLLAGGG
jgi:sulfur carrier protein ThiS